MGEPTSSQVTPIGLAATQAIGIREAQCKRVYEALCANNDLVSNIHHDSDTDYEALSKYLIEQISTLTSELKEILTPTALPMRSTA